MLRGGADDDALFGAMGEDRLFGGLGQDHLYGGVGDDFLNGGNDSDTLIGGLGHDTLRGGSGDDVLNGVMDSAIDDYIDARDRVDADRLDGGNGADRLILGSGDLAFGGADADTFATGGYVDAANVPVIEDFTSGEDVIEVNVVPGADYTISVDALASGGSVVLLDGNPVVRVNLTPSEIADADVVAVENPNLRTATA